MAEEIEAAHDSKDEFFSAVISRFSKTSSNKHQHQHIYFAIAAISQDLKNRKLPLKPIAYFGVTCSNLAHLSIDDPPPHLLDALITIMALAMDKISPAVLNTKYSYLLDLLMRIIQINSIGVNGIVPWLNCASRLVIARAKKVGWAADVSQLYGFLITYITDERSKVRKQSHSCLHEVLKCFQRVPVLESLLAPASEDITHFFERLLFLAGGSNNENASERPKIAQDILYILDSFKICLPYMSSKSSTNILKRFKSLVEVRQPVITRRITDALNAIFLHSVREDFAEDVLLDLLCSLAISLSSLNESSDSMTFTARLLDTGMKKVYSLNRQICVVKLPVVFNALNDVLVSGHKEASVAAMTTYKSLIGSCIDETLITQGVDQVTVNANMTTRISSPTIIEKVCTTIEILLDYRYEAVWDMSFQIVSTMFEKLGKYSFYLMEKTLNSLADMQNTPDGEFNIREQFHECMGSAIGAMGPEKFLSLLNREVSDLESEANIWLFPILKKYIVGAHLKFFTDSILPMIGTMKRKSAMLEQEGKLNVAKRLNGVVYSLWSLLPPFCNYPVDTAESFKCLEKALCASLQEDYDICGIICSSLQILIQQNKNILKGKENSMNMEISIPEERAIALHTSHVAGANLSVLKSSFTSPELMDVLIQVYFKSSTDVHDVFQNTIGELASISDKNFIKQCFLGIMKKLEEVTEEAGATRKLKNSKCLQVHNLFHEGSPSMKRAQLFDVAASLLPGLGSDEINILFRAIQPVLKEADGFIQTKAYIVLSLIFQFSDDFISKKIEEVCRLMIEVQPSCHFLAKRHRLDCIYFLFIHVSKEVSEQGRHEISKSFLTEIILALKEANKKTRNRAYDILIQIGHAFGDEEKGGKKEKLHQFFNMVAGGLASENPHMVSATMTGLARLTYEFSDLVSAAKDILPSTFLLMKRKNKEIIKANLGLLKILVAKSQAEGLQTHLRIMVEGLLSWQDSTRKHFKAKVKLLLEMLVEKCGLDAVKSVMPEDHMKLLTNLRKLKMRKEKKQAATFVETKSIQWEATTSRKSRWNHTRIFSDFDDEMSSICGGEFLYQRSIPTWQDMHYTAISQTKRSRKAAQSLQEKAYDQLDDEPLNLLDNKSGSDEELDIDSEGLRLIIHEDGKKYEKTDWRSERDSDVDVRSKSGSSRTSSMKDDQKRTGWLYTGKEYARKKAGIEPYDACGPLDRKMVPNHRAPARKGMASIVKLTKNLQGLSVSGALSMKGD